MSNIFLLRKVKVYIDSAVNLTTMLVKFGMKGNYIAKSNHSNRSLATHTFSDCTFYLAANLSLRRYMCRNATARPLQLWEWDIMCAIQLLSYRARRLLR